MTELVRADAASVRAVESFLARVRGEPVALGEVVLACGRAGALVAAAARAGGLTVGGRIFLSAEAGARVRERIGADGALCEGGALAALGRLFVHECAHVAQYRRSGTVGFLGDYLLSYCSSIYEKRTLARHARLAAYRSIPHEVEAFRCEACWEAEAAGELGDPLASRGVDPG